MAELGIVLRKQDPVDAAQLGAALALALALHIFLALFVHKNFKDISPLNGRDVIEVRLILSSEPQDETPQDQIVQNPAAENKEGPDRELSAQNTKLPDDLPQADTQAQQSLSEETSLDEVSGDASKAAANAAPTPEYLPPPILNSESGTSRGSFPEHKPESSQDYIPSQWALEPPLKGERLKSLGLFDDVECLRSLSTDCAALRKEVFAEFELTEMQKVWTAARADTGMSSEFYGLSEREIRLKIGSKIAGENGFMILPGIGIDGQLWDMLHGVKKGCEMKRGINSEGRYDVVRVCPDSLPAARDRKYYIPPKP